MSDEQQVVAEEQEAPVTIENEGAEAEVTKETASGSDEEHASRLGWVPKEQFRGDPKNWRDATEFLKRGTEQLPILSENLKRLQKKLDQQSAAFSEFRQFMTKSEERAYEKAKKEIEAERRKAVENADTEGFERAEKELERIERDKLPTPKSAANIEPEIAEFVKENGTWFDKDKVLTTYAIEVHGDILRESPGMSIADNLVETKRRLVEKFPEKFGINPKRNGASSVAAPAATAAPKVKPRTFEALPKEAQKQCAVFEKTIPGFKREDYLKNFAWD